MPLKDQVILENDMVISKEISASREVITIDFSDKAEVLTFVCFRLRRFERVIQFRDRQPAVSMKRRPTALKLAAPRDSRKSAAPVSPKL
jgi:hypothetical protein